MEKIELDKLKKLIPHWIEHNRSHKNEFVKWAEIASNNGLFEISESIKKASRFIDDANNALSQAQDELDQ